MGSLFDLEAPLSPWQEDLDYLYQQMPQVHANMFKNITSDEWRDQLANLGERAADTMSDDEIIIELREIVASIGASHTYVVLGYWPSCHWAESGEIICRSSPKQLPYAFDTYPVRVRSFPDGFWVVASTPELSNLIGLRLVAINGTPTESVAEALKPLMPEVNSSYLRQNVPRLLLRPEILAYNGFVTGSTETEFIFENQKEEQYEASLPRVALDDSRMFVGFTETTSVSLPLYLQEPDRLYWTRWLPESRLFYLSYRKCAEDTAQTVSDFIDETQEKIAAYDIQVTVIDLRENSGGNWNLMHPLFSWMAWNSKINRSGRLFVVTGIKTYSSAFQHMEFFDTWTNATVIGESPQARPYHGYGELGILHLPNSGVAIYYSKYYNWDIFCGELDIYAPEEEVVLSASDYFANRDPIIDYIKDGL